MGLTACVLLFHDISKSLSLFPLCFLLHSFDDYFKLLLFTDVYFFNYSLVTERFTLFLASQCDSHLFNFISCLGNCLQPVAYFTQLVWEYHPIEPNIESLFLHALLLKYYFAIVSEVTFFVGTIDEWLWCNY